MLQVVDSIMALFRVDFSGRGELADRQQKLAQMLSRLQKISEGERLQLCSSLKLLSHDSLHTSCFVHTHLKYVVMEPSN